LIATARYLTFATDRNVASAQYHSDLGLANGHVVSRDLVPADRNIALTETGYSAAADQGHSEGEANLGVCLEQDLGVQ
jgi:TPR repeat protein